MFKRKALTIAVIGALTVPALADLNMSGWTRVQSQVGKTWSPSGNGYGNDGYGQHSDHGKWGQASGGYDYSVNQMEVWQRGTEVRITINSGMRWNGRSGFELGDIGIDTNGDGHLDAALLRPDAYRSNSNSDFSRSNNGLFVTGLTDSDWRNTYYSQLLDEEWAVRESHLDASNMTGLDVDFDYDYRNFGLSDSMFYTATSGDRSNLVDNRDYVYSWTFDSADLPGGFDWQTMQMLVECGNDGIDMMRQVPAPGAVLLGVMGMGFVGSLRRRMRKTA